MPGLGLVAAVVLWAVAVAVAVGDQGRTPGVPTWAQRLSCHGLSPPSENKKPAPTSSPLEDHRHRLIRKHWPCSIFTRYSALQLRHQRIKRLALVSELAFWFVMQLQLGQTYRPFFMDSLTRLLHVCNGSPSLSSLIQLYSKIVPARVRAFL